jgi:hypothetical protein
MQIDKSEVETTKVHYLPCQFDYDGPAEVRSFFKVRQGKEENCLSSALRGHELIGEVMTVSQEGLPVRGFCVSKCDEDGQTKLRVMSEFDKMTVWQHDAKPDIPHMRDCINWFEISSALHS